MTKSESEGSYSFGPYVLDIPGKVLRKGAKELPLTRRRYEVLLMLVENAGRALSKDEIIGQIWADQNIDEANLANNIHALRRIIEEDPRHPRLIVTVPGVGYKFVGEVRLEKDPVPEAPNATKPVAAMRKIPPVLLIGVAMVGLLIAIGAFWLLGSRRPQTKPALFPVPLTAYAGAERYPALSADGGFIAFTWDGDSLANEDIYIKQTIESEPIRVTSHPGADRQATWSPDGRRLAFLRLGEKGGEPPHLMVVPALGGLEREIARVDGGLDWSPDGKFLAVTGLAGTTRRMGIHLIEVDGPESRQITTIDQDGKTFDSGPRFSPDGRWLAFLRWQSDAGSDIFIADLTNGSIRQLTTNRQLIKSDSLQWSPDSGKLFFISNLSGNMMLWQVGLWDGRPEIMPNLTIPITGYSIARRANLLVFVNEQDDTKIEVQGLGGSPPAPPCTINSSRSDTGPRLSPDGSMIVFSSNRTGWEELWVAQSDCTQIRQLTNLQELGVGSPRWSPDGKQVVFDRRNQKESDIYVIGINGENLRKLTDSIGSNTLPSWSPDGQWIYFTSNRAVPRYRNQIWKIPAAGGTPVQVTKQGGWEPSLSADGQWLYYNHANRLWQMDLAGGLESPIGEMSEIYLQRNWTVGLNAIFFLPYPARSASAIHRFDLKTRMISTLPVVKGLPIDEQPALSVSPDGRIAAVSVINIQFSDIMMVRDWQ